MLTYTGTGSRHSPRPEQAAAAGGGGARTFSATGCSNSSTSRGSYGLDSRKYRNSARAVASAPHPPKMGIIASPVSSASTTSGRSSSRGSSDDLRVDEALAMAAMSSMSSQSHRRAREDNNGDHAMATAHPPAPAQESAAARQLAASLLAKAGPRFAASEGAQEQQEQEEDVPPQRNTDTSPAFSVDLRGGDSSNGSSRDPSPEKGASSISAALARGSALGTATHTERHTGPDTETDADADADTDEPPSSSIRSTSMANPLKSARRHSENGMRTPIDEGGPHPRPGFGFTQYSTALSSGSANGSGAGSGFGARTVGAVEGGAPQDSSNPAALEARRQDRDVDTRPARRKLYRVDTEEQQREREAARLLQQQQEQQQRRRPSGPHALAAHTSTAGASRQGSQRGESGERRGSHQSSSKRSQLPAHAPAVGAQLSTSAGSSHAHPGGRPSSEKRRVRRQQQEQPQPPQEVPHMDISTYPTASLLHLLAELLTRITANNDEGGSTSPEGPENAEAPAGARTARSPPRTPAASGRDRSGSTASSVGRGREPVTPAVPFPSPAGAPAGFGSASGSDPDVQHQCQQVRRAAQAAGYPFPHVGASESTDTVSGAAATRDMEEEDEEVYEPRLNFAAPEHSTYSTITRQHATSRADALGSPTRRSASDQQRGAMFAMMEEDPAAPPRAGRLARSSSAGPSSIAQHQQHYLRDRPSVFTSAANALSIPNATLCFHARNVPSISIESYLVRISKYCPTTNEVFISLLVYFDRMSHLPDLSEGHVLPTFAGSNPAPLPSSFPSPAPSLSTVERHRFAVDSFNIHRLIISGITVASKFFSDVFYTNSRYAKVGGLPLAELNALELQFLLLNGFDLLVPPEELQRYADHLLRGELPPSLTEYHPQYEHAIEADAALAAEAHDEAELAALAHATESGASESHPRPHSLTREAVVSELPRPKSGARSTSESSASASESSTVVPSESSVDTERAGHDEDDHREHDEDDAELSEERQQDRTMRDPADDPFLVPRLPAAPPADGQAGGVSGAGLSAGNSPMGALPVVAAAAAVGLASAFLQHQCVVEDGAQPPSSQAQEDVGGHTEVDRGAMEVVESCQPVAGVSTSGKRHRRQDSRTREWTMSQQQHHLHGDGPEQLEGQDMDTSSHALPDQDAEMTDPE